MEIKLEHNIKELTKHIEDQHKRQIPFAVHQAMGKTLHKTMQKVQSKVNSSFTGIVPLTQRAVFYRINPPLGQFKRTPLDQIFGQIYLNDDAGKGTPAAKYLEPQIIGGQRKNKRSEVLLTMKGILKSGEQIIPSKYYQDSLGNIKAGITRKVLTDLQAHTEVGHTMNRREKSLGGRDSRFVYISKRRGRQPHGIYERKGKNLIPVFFIASVNQYKARLPFQKISQEAFNEHWGNEFKLALDRAIATAK